jgi:uncharacterized protein YbcI
MSIDAIHARGRGEIAAEISTALVQLHSEYYGKGPTKAKTHLVDDTVVCILRGGFTAAEHTLLTSGNADAVYRVRHSFQDVMESEFRGAVESATDCKVIAYMSTVHFDPEMAIEIFVLGEPAAADEPAQSGGSPSPSVEAR